MIATREKIRDNSRQMVDPRNDISFSLFVFNFRDGFDSLPLSYPRRYLGLTPRPGQARCIYFHVNMLLA